MWLVKRIASRTLSIARRCIFMAYSISYFIEEQVSRVLEESDDDLSEFDELNYDEEKRKTLIQGLTTEEKKKTKILNLFQLHNERK